MCTRSRFRITIVQFVDLNQKMYSICIYCLWNLLYKKGLVKKKWLYIHAMSSNIIARKWKNSVENRDFLWGFWFMCGLFLFSILNFVAHFKKNPFFFLFFIFISYLVKLHLSKKMVQDVSVDTSCVYCTRLYQMAYFDCNVIILKYFQAKMSPVAYQMSNHARLQVAN